MKKSRNISIAIIVAITLFSAFTYIACSKKDKCLNVVCQNGGACDNGKCKCLVGYEGPRCDSLIRDRYVSVYDGGDSCGSTPTTDSVYRPYSNPLRLTARIFYPIELLMTNFLNDPNDSAYCTIIATDSFTFLGANNSTQYNGTGWFRHDTLHMQYHVIHDTTSYYCTYLGLYRY